MTLYNMLILYGTAKFKSANITVCSHLGLNRQIHFWLLNVVAKQNQLNLMVLTIAFFGYLKYCDEACVPLFHFN